MMILRGLATRRDFGARIPTWLLVAVPTAIGAIANLLWIGRQSLWQDEGVTAQVVTTTWPGFWNDITTAYGGGMTGYFLLLRMWPFHDDEQGLRSLSALFMIASVPLVFWIGKELGGRAAGWWAASIFALWPFIVSYGQEARPYGLLVLITVAATAALLKATRPGGRRWWAAYGVLLGLGMYAQMFALLMVLPHAVWIVMRRPPRRHVAMAAGLAVLVASPMVVLLFFHFGTPALNWIPRPTLGWLWTDVVQPMTWYSRSLLAALMLAVLGLGAVAIFRQRDELPRLALLVSWATLPLLVALGYSLLIHPVLQPRYVIYIIPAWAVLLGVAIAKIPARVASVAVGFVVLAICAQSLQGYYSGYLKPDFRDAAALVSSQTQPGDAVIEEDGMEPALDYYWRNSQKPTVGTTGSRLWVIQTSNPVPPESIAADWRLASRTDFYQVSVALYLPVTAAER
jgi:mannosyltransferase